VYHDADEDCTYNGFDLPLANKVLEILPGPAYAITAWDGTYSQGSVYGDFTIGQSLLNETQLCPSADPQPYTLDAAQPLAIVDFANLSDQPHDLSVHISSTAARPGFATQVWINILNTSAFPSGDVTIDLAFDPVLSDPLPSDGHWEVGVIPPFTGLTRSFQALVPADINLLGTVLSYSATVANTATEVITTNNNATLDVTITGSYDPNDKRGLTSSRTSADQYFLDQDDHLDYTVRFQNTGTDTAFTVVIRDELDSDLGVTSLQILGASHDFVPSFGEGRELVFTFNNINLPDSTTDLLGSQGYISYRIKPIDGIVIGEVIQNTAGIYFDFNPPIITNTTSHVVDFSTALAETPSVARTLLVSPNPVHEVLVVTLPDATSMNWQLLSIDGRSIHLPHTYSSGTMQLDVRHLDPGTYVFRSPLGIATFVKQ